MLRSLLGEAPSQWEGLLGETDRAMGAFIGLVRERTSGQPEEAVRLHTYAIWAEGLRRSLEELEESIFAAGFFAARIHHERWGELSDPEKKDYDRHVYFDKNAYIRMFSLLDKLGTLMNDLLALRTEKIKPKFSYYTVLRRMRESGRYPELAEPLTALKETNREAMNRLRTRRNTEIHFMNAELQDDLFAEKASHGREAGETGRLENLAANLADLRMGWDMVLGTLERSFRYACERLRHSP